MARIKREQDRDEKRGEIIVAARQLFIEEGYEATSINRLAKAARVAPNTIYWYFKDKDEVLVAVLDAEFSARMNEYLALETNGPADRLLWVANQLESVNRLVGTVHSRMAQSPVINAWHNRFHTLSEELLRQELEQSGATPQKIEALVKISVFTIEGLLAHPLPEDQKRAICTALVTF